MKFQLISLTSGFAIHKSLSYQFIRILQDWIRASSRIKYKQKRFKGKNYKDV